jgi:NTP pyrophosphatase (non-canonical NTP hydrolase)
MIKETGYQIKREVAMTKKLLIVVGVAVCLWGCVENELKFSIRFHQINGLEKGDRVLFDNNHIGTVTKVFYSETGNYLVDVAIKKDFKNAATNNANFFIVDDPQKSPGKAINITGLPSGGEIILAGSTVEGSDPPPTLFDLSKGLETGLKMLNQKIEEMAKKYGHILDEAKKIPESEAYRNLEKELQHLLEQMKNSSKSVQEQIEKEIIPKFQKEMERLKKEMETPMEPEQTPEPTSNT